MHTHDPVIQRAGVRCYREGACSQQIRAHPKENSPNPDLSPGKKETARSLVMAVGRERCHRAPRERSAAIGPCVMHLNWLINDSAATCDLMGGDFSRDAAAGGVNQIAEGRYRRRHRPLTQMASGAGAIAASGEPLITTTFLSKQIFGLGGRLCCGDGKNDRGGRKIDDVTEKSENVEGLKH